MKPWRPALDDWFRTHVGIISSSELFALGCSERTLRRMVARGELTTLHPGVFGTRQWPDERMQRLAAMCARDPDVLVAFTTACRSWSFRRVTDDRLHALVPHTSAITLEGVIVHRCRQIDPVDIVERPDGIRLTSPPRTLFDSADMLGLSAARSVIRLAGAASRPRGRRSGMARRPRAQSARRLSRSQGGGGRLAGVARHQDRRRRPPP